MEENKELQELKDDDLEQVSGGARRTLPITNGIELDIIGTTVTPVFGELARAARPSWEKGIKDTAEGINYPQ